MADGAITRESLRERLVRRLGQLKGERELYQSDWQELASYFVPRQERYLQGSTQNPGRSRSSKIVRNTPLTARNVFTAGMMAGLTSPARPWFRLTTPDPALSEYGPVKAWLWAVEQRMREIFARSNFYNALPTSYQTLGTFATTCLLALEDPKDVVRFYPQALGTYWLGQSNRLQVDTMYREFQLTVRQVVQEFGEDAPLSLRTRGLIDNKNWEQKIDIVHAVEPNSDYQHGAIGPRGMRWRSCYFEKTGERDVLLAERGYEESPVLAPRWDVIGNETYGSDCPGMIALPATKALMVQERRKAQAIDKLVTPPLAAPTALRNQLIDAVAGGTTYFDSTQGNVGVKPLYEVRPDINALVADIQETGGEIEQAWFVDLFLAISRMEGVQPRNVMELAERKEEKLLQLGPALERLNDELLDPCIDRVFSIMVRASKPLWDGVMDGEPMIPAPPQELEGMDLRVEYISILAQAQKAIGVSSLDRLVAFTGNLATLKQDPSVWDKLDTDQAIDEYGEMLGGSPLVVRSDDDVEKLRKGRQQQQAAQQLAAAAQPMAQAARGVKDLAGAVPQDGSALTQLAGSPLVQQLGQQAMPGMMPGAPGG